MLEHPEVDLEDGFRNGADMPFDVPDILHLLHLSFLGRRRPSSFPAAQWKLLSGI